MAYYLKRKESVIQGVRRITGEQLAKVRDELHPEAEDLEEAIHDARKRFKKLRGLLRLVRKSVGEEVYQRENARFRDAARRLSSVRDAQVHRETIEKLSRRFSEQLESRALQRTKASLTRLMHEQVRETVHENSGFEDVLGQIACTEKDAKKWPVGKGFEAVAGGLRKTYKRGRKAMSEAEKEATTENFHEWRKRVKYLWYHVRLLKRTWPKPMKHLGKELHRLSDLLGDDHDLAILARLLEERPELSGDERERELVLGLIREWRKEFQEEAFPLGRRIYAEEPDRFVERIGDYWETWRDEEA